MSHPVEASDVTVYPGQTSSVSLWTVLAELTRYRLVTFGLPILAAVVVGVIAALMQREYIAAAAILPGSAKSPNAQFGQIASVLGISLGNASGETPQLYAELLRSREVLRGVLESPASTNGRSIEDTWFLGKGARAANLTQLRKRVDVGLENSTGIVRAKVVMRDSVAAEVVTRALLNSLERFNLQRRHDQTGSERRFTEEQLETARDSLRVSENRLAQFLASNRRFNESPELVAAMQRLQREADMRQQVYSSLAVQLASLRIEEVRATPLYSVIEAPEGNVVPRSRGVIVKALLAFVVTLVLTWTIVLARRALRQQSSRPDFRELKTTLGR